jgi:hypothetical protein
VALDWTICPYCAHEPAPRPRKLEETMTLQAEAAIKQPPQKAAS